MAIALAVAYALPLAAIVALFLRGGRTPYDVVSGTHVLPLAGAADALRRPELAG